MKLRKNKGSSHANQHNYLRPELWANGVLAFYLKSGYNTELYLDFHNRQILEAQRLGKL